jgi:hypothetical protein
MENKQNGIHHRWRPINFITQASRYCYRSTAPDQVNIQAGFDGRTRSDIKLSRC